MARSFSITPSRVLGLKDGKSWYDSRNYPVLFYPPSDTLSITGQTVTFPDFNHANAYGYAAGLIGADVYQSCSSYVTIPYQDWGPSDQPGISDTLSDTVIGTIPADADVFIARVNLTRTTTPDQVLGNTIPVVPKEGEWVIAEGGTLLLESLFPVTRMIWIRLAATDNGDGTRNVLLSRKQSIGKHAYTHWRAGNDPNNSGWTYGGTNGRFGHLVQEIQSKGPTLAPGGVITYRRGDGGQCSLTDSSDYGSVYDMDIEIIPGRSAINVERIGGGALAGTSLIFADVDAIDGSATTHTYSNKFLGPAPEAGQTRDVFVSLIGYKGAQSSSSDLDSVTIAGVTATLVAKRNTYLDLTGSTDTNEIAAIYRATIASGESGDIVLTFSASYWFSAIQVYAVYNLESTTPLETVAENIQTTTTRSLTSDLFGVAFGVYFNNSTSGTQTQTGFGTDFSEDVITTAGASVSSRRIFGYGMLDSASDLVISVANNASANAIVMATFSGVPPKAFELTDSKSREGSASSTHSFADVFISAVPETNEHRYVIVAVGVKGTGASFDFSGVTLDGVSMDQRAVNKYQTAGDSYLVAFYVLQKDTSETGSVVVTLNNASALESFIDVYAAYNLDATTAVDTESSADASASHSGSINTSARGICIGFGIEGFTGTENLPVMAGLANEYAEQVTTHLMAARTYDVTDGSAESVGFTSDTMNNQFVWMSIA